MRRDYGRLQISRVIVHDIPQRFVRLGGEEPQLSDDESDLDDELRTFIRERLAESLKTAARDVVFDTDSPSPIRSLVAAQLDGGDLISTSHDMARHLYACQTGRQLRCLLVVALGTYPSAKSPCAAIMKLEREEGARVDQTERSGRRTFQLRHVRDLMLTKKTRVFKVGLFWRSDDGKEILGGVADHQRGRRAGGDVADFFLRDFLGCRPREDPEITTRKFFEASEKFINAEVADPEARGRFEIALLAELGSVSAEINPREFAERTLATEQIAGYLRFMDSSDVPIATFDKDIAAIATRIRRVQWQFQSGIRLLGAPEALEDHVSIRSLDDGQANVVITDRLTDVSSRS